MLEVADSLSIAGHDVPFIGSANIWVDDSVVDDSSVLFTQWLVQQAVLHTHPGQLEVTIFDDQLTGLAAPFALLNTGGEKLLRSIHDMRELGAFFAHLRDHVHAVNAVVQGRAASLLEFRRDVGHPVESYKLVVLGTDISLLDEAIQRELCVLLRAGGRAGVTFIIHSPASGIEWVRDMCTQYTIRRGQLRSGDASLGVVPPAPAADELIASASTVASRLAATSIQSVPFTAVQELGRTWCSSSADGLTFSVGRFGRDTVEITLGDELNQRHNMLITGAVGQGKSNLLSVVIHSLCERYSPKEIELYLLDFKEGVTLQPFFKSESGEYLPHATVLGLEADREFGLSVLQDLHRRYRERMRLFKELGVQSISAYRHARPEASLPRIVVIIDEFQMLFADRDRISERSADLLIKGVRLFRAAGVHFVLASQTIGGNLQLMGSAGDGLFNQVPVRIALKNSVAESRATLGNRNDAAAHLRSREAIVNVDYGELGANQKTSIAFADESLLASVRNSWWKAACSYTRPPYVFAGEARRSLWDDARRIDDFVQSGPATALLGLAIEVGGRTLEAPLYRDIGRNIVGIGPGEMGIQLLSIAVSAALSARRNGSVRLVILDGAPEDGICSERFAWFRQNSMDARLIVDYVARDAISERLRDAMREVESGAGDSTVIYVAYAMDRCRDLGSEFQTLSRIGPPAGHHIIGSWMKLDAFREHVGYGGEAYFDVKFGLRLDSQTAKQLLNDPLLDWRPSDNRMIVFDSATMSEPIRAVPYSRFS
jgi:hypothetical protein